jgi:HSP20 family protein
MPTRDKDTRGRSSPQDERNRSNTRDNVPITGRGTNESRERGSSVSRSSQSPRFGIMRQLSDEMTRFFGNFGFTDDLLGTSADDRFAVPQVDVLRRGNDLVVRADLPGLSKENISIDVSGDMLTIRGERREESKEEREGYYWHERSSGSFARRIPLPENADVDHASARFENGVLEVSIPAPEHERSQSHRIDIK